MKRPATLNVTEQTIDLSNLSPETWDYFVDMSNKIRERYLAIGKPRVVFALAGPGGAGKSVVSAIFAHLMSEGAQDFEFINVGADAYHYSNQKLVDLGRKEVKGRYDTYDIAALKSDLTDFKAGKSVQFPIYSRKIHEPIQNSLVCEAKNALLWLEGGWLLYPEEGWGELIKLYDYSYFITATEADVSTQVINRHIKGGRETEDAKNFYERSDVKNINLVLEKSLPADENLKFWRDVV